MSNLISDKVIEDLIVYFEINQLLNKSLIEMYTISILNKDSFSKFNVNMDEFSTRLFQIIPINQNSKITLDRNSGILLISDAMKLHDFTDEFNTIIELYFETISGLKKFRNKMQHEPHNININSLNGTNEEFGIMFEYKNNSYEIDSNDIKNIVMKINILFCDLVKKIKKCDLSKEQSSFINNDYHKLKFDDRTYIEMNNFINSKNKRYLRFILDKY